MSPSTTDRANQTAAAEAAEWFIRLQGKDVSRRQQEDFAGWLRRSPVHVEEFLQLTALQGELARLPEFNSIDVERGLANLAPLGEEDNVVSFETVGPGEEAAVPATTQLVDGPDSTVGRSARAGRALLAAAAAVVAVAIGFSLRGPFADFFGKERYKTEIGEQRSLTLADGTQVQLNARSNLSAMVNASVRDIRLSDGEALFRVAKDPQHPFRVHTPEATIEAKGTQFNVQVVRGVTTVSLLEGHVLVSTASANSVLLNPGDQISVAADSVSSPKPHSADLKAAIAWTEHRLVFEDATLSEVIAEFNRYSRQPFVIDDPALRNIRITASFDSSSTQTFAASLAAARDLRVTHQPSGVWLIERK